LRSAGTRVAQIFRHPQRLLFASDVHIKRRWDTYQEDVAEYRRFAGELSENIATDMSYRNAERAYGATIGAAR